MPFRTNFQFWKNSILWRCILLNPIFFAGKTSLWSIATILCWWIVDLRFLLDMRSIFDWNHVPNSKRKNQASSKKISRRVWALWYSDRSTLFSRLLRILKLVKKHYCTIKVQKSACPIRSAWFLYPAISSLKVIILFDFTLTKKFILFQYAH